jgi:hypothetical protein
MMLLASIGATEYLIFGGALLVSLVAFFALILTPALGSFGRTWEKATAALLSVFVLVALAGLGVGLGLLIVLHWPEISSWF